MPSHNIKSFAKKSGKSVQEVEKIWDESKEAAMKKFGKQDGHFWSYVNSVTQKKCGITEEKLSFRNFLELISG